MRFKAMIRRLMEIAKFSIFLALFWAQSEAAVVTVQFSGHFSYAPTSFLTPYVGTGFSGQYTYDTLAPNKYPTDPVYGQYNVISGYLTAEGVTVPFEISDPAPLKIILITNDFSGPGVGDHYNFNVDFPTGISLPVGGPLLYIDLGLYDPSGTVFTSTALPTGAPDLASFSTPVYADFYMTFTSNAQIVGNIDTISTVPIPAAAWLFVSSIAVLGCGLGFRGRSAGTASKA